MLQQYQMSSSVSHYKTSKVDAMARNYDSSLSYRFCNTQKCQISRMCFLWAFLVWMNYWVLQKALQITVIIQCHAHSTESSSSCIMCTPIGRDFHFVDDNIRGILSLGLALLSEQHLLLWSLHIIYNNALLKSLHRVESASFFSIGDGWLE